MRDEGLGMRDEAQQAKSEMASQIMQAKGGGKTHCSGGYTITPEYTHTAEQEEEEEKEEVLLTAYNK